MQNNNIWWLDDQYRYYIRHLYFVVTTCTTIGYGDITPSKESNSELVFGITAMLAGLSVMSVFLTLSQILLKGFKDQSVQLHKRMKDFDYWFETIEKTSKAEFPERYVKKLKEFFKALYNLEVDTVVYSKFLDQLPAKVAEELEEEYHLAQESPFQVLFDMYGKELSIGIIKGCQPCSFFAGSTILHRGKYSPGIYWITYGTVKVTYINDTKPVIELEEGDSFGSFCLLDEQSRFNYIAKSTCMAHFLPLEKLKDILDENGNSGQYFREQVKKDFEELQKEKIVCKSLNKFRTPC